MTVFADIGGNMAASPLPRGAWIEIISWGASNDPDGGRPSREGRGLKSDHPGADRRPQGRPSREGRGLKFPGLKLTKEMRGRPSREGRGLKSYPFFSILVVDACRPSREGRGLKSALRGADAREDRVAPPARGVD